LGPNWKLAPQPKVSSNRQGVTRIEGRVVVTPLIYKCLLARLGLRPQLLSVIPLPEGFFGRHS